MDKDFDNWNKEKKNTNSSNNEIIFYEREVWWATMGINIGVEIDGKHEKYLRPVIVLRKFNKYMAIVVPTTAQVKKNKYYFEVKGNDEKTYNCCLSQIKSISTKRLFRKIGTINKDNYNKLLYKISLIILGKNDDTTP